MRTLICLVSALLSSTVVAQDHRLTAARLDGDVLRLQASDGLQVVRHFQLPNPPRVVLDLFGLDGSVAEMPAPAASSPALEVRTGEHPNFVRLVVDLREGLEAYQVRRSGETIEVGLGPAKLPPSQTGVLIGPSQAPADPLQPPASLARVVDVGVEATPSHATGASTSPPSTTATPATAGPRSDPQSLGDLTTDELLALIDEELKAAGLDQEQSAEELIKQVEAELDASGRNRGSGSRPLIREAAPAEERRLRRPSRPAQTPPARDNEERFPFRFIDEEPAKKPLAEENDGDSDN